MIKIKRAYDKPAPDDGQRILVDRLWPRGLTKKRAAVDRWLKDLAPSPELRKWFGHDPARWRQFQTRYRQELREHKEMLRDLKREAKKHTVTLVYGTPPYLSDCFLPVPRRSSMNGGGTKRRG